MGNNQKGTKSVRKKNQKQESSARKPRAVLEGRFHSTRGKYEGADKNVQEILPAEDLEHNFTEVPGRVK